VIVRIVDIGGIVSHYYS